MSARLSLLILLLLLLLGVAVVTLASLYNPDYLKTFFLAQIEHQLGRRIDVGQARLEIFPRIRLELSQVVIRDLDPSQVFFSADRVDLVLRAIPLLRQQVVGKRLTIERPHVTLRRGADGRWNMFSAPRSGFQEIKGHPFSLLPLISKTVLVNGQVTVVDETQPGAMRTLHLGSLGLALAIDQKGYRADLRMSMNLQDAPTRSSLSLVGTFTRANTLARMASEGSKALTPVFQFDGIAEAADVSLSYLAKFFAPRSLPPKLPRSTSARGHLKLIPGEAGYNLVLSEMSLKVEPLSITGQASLSGLMTPQPMYSITVASPGIDLEKALKLVPVEWLSPEAQAELVQRKLGGTVEVVAATVSGSFAQDTNISLNGEFRLVHGHMLFGKDRTLIREVAATALLERDRIRIVALTGFYGTMHVIGGKAMLSYADTAPWLELEVAGDMLAKDLVAAMAGSAKPGSPWSVLKEIQDVQGGTLLTFRIVGPLKRPEELHFVEGEIAVQEVGFRTNVFPAPFTGVAGRIRFSEKGTEFDHLHGRMGQSFVEIQGVTEAGDPSLFRDFLVRIKGQATDMTWFLPTGIGTHLSLQGTVGAALALSGPVNAPTLRGVADLTATGLTIPGVLEKIAGSPASIEFDGTLPRKGPFTLSRLDLVLPPFRLKGKGRTHFGKVPEVNATVVSAPVSISDLPQGLRLGNLNMKDGIVELSLDIKGKGLDWKAWQLTGWVAITDGLISAKGLDNPITNLYLRMQLIKDKADLRRLAFRIKDSDLQASGLIRRWAHPPAIHLKVESVQLDLELLIPKSGRSPIRDLMETLAASTRLAGTVNIGRGLYKGMEFTDMAWQVKIGQSIVDVDRISARSKDSRVAGRLLMHLPEQKPADVEVAFRVTDFPFEQGLKLAGDQSHLIKGSLTASGTVRGNGSDPRGMLHAINGQTDFVIKEGRFQKGTVIARIIEILNLPNLLRGKVELAEKGFPFDKLSGKLSIRNGLIKDEKLIVDSPVMKMSGAGTYDMTTNQLDIVVVTSPLGSYAQLLKSIPLFGRVLKGERHGLDTAIFEVKGPIQNPSVRYLATESLRTGLTGVAQLAYDVLKNTFLLPKELIE